ncbi:uncharacterized protein N0V89_000316 [Didymosphaeria variabile]|uniref:Early meiotic induction protein 1 n=1 Tax=Didymosphaeria variabile TaxID=1932322 RepID=A0A9W8XWH7_9PLEO|nr:uncharacterized protein N0V89_000316 [Didymosphaeria variabile]KAJ4359760.1 hypothetical protein N0V89_000316 [Didymosphaeria variabile]
MGWLWTSSSSKAEPQQPTPSSIPIRSEPAPSPPANTNEASFNEAFPHLAPTPSQPSQSPNTSASTETDNDPSLPTTMSCRAAFDAAFYCSSLGGHFNDIYRYGHLRSCSEHWADWRFCMSLTGASSEGRANAIRERYREKDAKVKKAPNSEDVWKRRGPGEMIERPFRFAEEESLRVEKA